MGLLYAINNSISTIC